MPADFKAVGYAANQVARMASRGEIEELQPRVYLLAGVPDSRELRITAAALAGGERAALSHATAAELHELRHVPRRLTKNRIDLTYPRGYKPAVRDVILHRPLYLPAEHVVRRGDRRLTTIERTLVDLSGLLAPRTYERVVDATLAEERTTCEATWEVVGALGSFPGVQLARRTIERFDPRMVGSRSELERTFFRGLRERGIDLPQANVAIVDADGRRRYLDFAYVPERLPIEVDSDRYHASVLGRAADGARQNAIVLTGEWRTPLRFGERDIRADMARVAREVQQALDLARIDVGRS